MSARIDEARRRWTALLGPNRALFDGDTAPLARTTGVDPRAPLAILRPEHREQVADIVRIAAECRVALYPVSCGKNWGYGDALAVTHGQAIVDLSDLRRIIEVNDELSYAIIEPGVTQGQLAQHLRDHGHRCWVDCTGSSPDTSVLGNSLERGLGASLLHDHFLRICSLEVVLSDGRTLRTGYDHFERATTGPVARWGVGPYLDGLFSQSTLGIVTQASVWLTRKPAAYEVFAVDIEEHSSLPALVDALRELSFDHVFQSGVAVVSDTRQIAARRRFPWDETAGQTPLSPAMLRALRDELGVSAWTAFGAFYGSRAIVDAGKRELRERLSSIGSVTIARADDPDAPLRMRSMIDAFGGTPILASQHAARWRLRHAPHETSMNPLDSDIGLYWLAPTCRQTGADATKLVDLLSSSMRSFGFDPLVTLLFNGQRALVAPAMLAFDRTISADRDAAQRCYQQTTARLVAEGFIPYRVGTETMAQLASPDDVFDDVVERLHAALDPAGIMAPGRYQPRVARDR